MRPSAFAAIWQLLFSLFKWSLRWMRRHCTNIWWCKIQQQWFVFLLCIISSNVTDNFPSVNLDHKPFIPPFRNWAESLQITTKMMTFPETLTLNCFCGINTGTGVKNPRLSPQVTHITRPIDSTVLQVRLGCFVGGTLCCFQSEAVKVR